MTDIIAEKERLVQSIQRKKAIQLKQAKINFWRFCLYMDYDFFIDRPHCKEMAELMQKVHEGVYDKIAISAPPRAGKSYTGTMYVAFIIGNDPTGCVMRNCYGATLARKFSRHVKEILKKDKYKAIFPDLSFSRVDNRADEWSLTVAKQSTYFCGGADGPITGSGANLVAILDDPIKNWKEACSVVVTEGLWEWYISTHCSRFEENCPEIHLTTRWTRNDPTGKMEAKGKFDKVLVIQALDEHGKSFCEKVRTTEQYHETKTIVDPMMWNAMYMGKPIQAEGLLFPSESLNYFELDELHDDPDGVAGFGDVADEGTDYLSFPVGAVYGHKIFITDVVFSQDNVELTQPVVAYSIIKNEIENARFESNNGGKLYAMGILSLIQGESYRSNITWRVTKSNKETRILMQSGFIKKYCYFRNDYEQGSDYDKFMSQFTTYMKSGKNTHDDAADSVEGLCDFIKTDLVIYRDN